MGCIPKGISVPLAPMQVAVTSTVTTTIEAYTSRTQETTIVARGLYTKHTDGTQYWRITASTNEMVASVDGTTGSGSLFDREAIAFTNGTMMFAVMTATAGNGTLLEYSFGAIGLCRKHGLIRIPQAEYFRVRARLGIK